MREEKGSCPEAATMKKKKKKDKYVVRKLS